MNLFHKLKNYKNEMMYKTLIIFFCLYLLNSSELRSQYSELGIGVGLTTYWGDLNSDVLLNNITTNSGLAFQLQYKYLYRNRWGLKAAFTHGQVKAHDQNSSLDWQKLRNLSFRSPINEFGVFAEYYILGFNSTKGSFPFQPYISLGATYFAFNPSTIYQGYEIELQPLGTEGQGLPGYPDLYRKHSYGLAFGGGAKWIFSEAINLSADILMRRTGTDYLDDISTYYINYDEFKALKSNLAPELSNRMGEYLGQSESVRVATGSQRGGKDITDYYFVAMISLNIMLTDNKGRKRFGGRNAVICPTF
ncbi:MAG: DUF6089 family protein [Saprospiraceae bacterium]